MKPMRTLWTVALLLMLTAAAAVAGMMDNKDTMKKEMKGDMQPMMSTERTGQLAGIDGHQAAGTVTLKHLDDGDVLVLTGLAVQKVPDGHVFLAKDGDYKHGLDLGRLTRFSGSQTLTIPAGAMLDQYDSVVIWCLKFNVGIGQATLKP